MPAMRLDDGLDETEAEAEAALGAAAVTAKQALPDPWQLVGGDTGTGITNGQKGGSAITSDFYLHAAAERGVFDGVVDQVRSDLLETGAIGIHDRTRRTDRLRNFAR